jgi:hypothetical protein
MPDFHYSFAPLRLCAIALNGWVEAASLRFKKG